MHGEGPGKPSQRRFDWMLENEETGRTNEEPTFEGLQLGLVEGVRPSLASIIVRYLNAHNTHLTLYRVRHYGHCEV